MEAAAQQGDIDSLYRLIEQNPHVLEEIDSTPFVQTPLHVAACAGHVQFAIEIMTLKPSFAWKFNPQGRRPVHLALENGHTTMVLQLIQMDRELIRAKGREGLTLLHLASQSGDINLLTAFLKAYPDSLKDLTTRGETALHFAVKHGKFEALKLLISRLGKNTTVKRQTVLNQRDMDGNTILHIAATNNDTEAMELLIEVMTDLDAANLVGQRAFDIINNERIRNNLVKAEARVRKFRKFQGLFKNHGLRAIKSNEIRNAYLVVATLIATATYQAALSPPGGFHQIDSTGTNNTVILGHGALNSSEGFEGKSVMSNTNFIAFSITNMCAFATSILTIILLMPKTIVWIPLQISSTLLLFSYLISMTVISPNDNTTSLMILIWAFLFTFPGMALAWVLIFVHVTLSPPYSFFPSC